MYGLLGQPQFGSDFRVTVGTEWHLEGVRLHVGAAAHISGKPNEHEDLKRTIN